MTARTERGAAGLVRQVAGAVRWNALLPLKIAASSAASLALTNALAKEDYGVIVLVTSLAGLLGTWIDMGVERSLPKFYPEVERDFGRPGLLRFIREIALFKLAIVALLILLMLLGRDWFFAFWADRASDPVVREQLAAQRWWLFGGLVALLVLGAIFDVLMQVLVAYFRQKQFNLISLVTAVLQPVLLIGAVVFNLGIPGIIAALVVVPALASGLAWRTAAGALTASLAWRTATGAGAGAAPGTGWRAGFYRRLAAYSLTNYGLQLSGLLTSFQFAVLFLAGLAAPAEFRVGYFLPNQALQVLFSPLNGLHVPLFARLREEHDPAHTQAAYSLLSRFLLLVFCPAAVGLVVLAPNLTNILWPKYAESAAVAAVMAVGLFGGSALAVARTILLVHEVYRPIVVSRLVGLLAVPLLLWLAPAYGPLGAALAIGSTGLLTEVVAWLWATRVLGLAYPWRFAGRVLLASLVMAAVIWPLAALLLPVAPTLSVIERAGPALAGQLAIAAVGAATYLALLRLLGGLDPADRRAVTTLGLPGTRLLLRVL